MEIYKPRLSSLAEAKAARGLRAYTERTVGAFVEATFDMAEGPCRVAAVNAYAVSYPVRGYDTHICQMDADRLVVRRYASCD